MKIKKQNYLGLDHEAVIKKFSGDLTFVNYMGIRTQGGSKAAAVYHAKNPNRELGHKDYMLLFTQTDPVLFRTTMYVSGRSKEEMEDERHHDGVLCLECQTVILSLSGHDYVTCDCENSAMTDGGQNSYSRYGAKDMKKIRSVKVDLLTDEIKVIDEN